ncbi:MAG: hypothetical protein IPN03_20160 [Holophagales bacterium]|nr:hypothetical protein [Holophagales bacterium]
MDKVSVKSDRVDLYLTVASRSSCPARRTLHPLRRRSCRVQFMVDVPAEVIKGRRMDDVDAQLLDVVGEYESAAAPRRSVPGTGASATRIRATTKTLARHAAWKAEGVNRALAATRMAALDAASQR